MPDLKFERVIAVIAQAFHLRPHPAKVDDAIAEHATFPLACGVVIAILDMDVDDVILEHVKSGLVVRARGHEIAGFVQNPKVL